jgi:hypothetical protein
MRSTTLGCRVRYGSSTSRLIESSSDDRATSVGAGSGYRWGIIPAQRVDRGNRCVHACGVPISSRRLEHLVSERTDDPALRSPRRCGARSCRGRRGGRRRGAGGDEDGSSRWRRPLAGDPGGPEARALLAAKGRASTNARIADVRTGRAASRNTRAWPGGRRTHSSTPSRA